ncbi:hypothetical protein QA640_45840 (plasmid) [Bradyrhizobium sp. CB82]|uniref:hypothetical protein n=1 Tax=Bradyrhizobium sp. CB82 TaxID=3039159 RepID=UPI0024B1323F|nr:hypothetical protein [Bradyrhizobium sp. CB82]WFU46157.1 hypothetical protein QA640_45840 [Bradyrhizobium sp. CB82]
MTELGDFTRPMMRGSAGFQADQARGNLAKEVNDLLAPQLTNDDDLARTIHAVHLEHVLGEINADGANLHVDDPPPVIRGSTITLWHIRCRERASSTTSFSTVSSGIVGRLLSASVVPGTNSALGASGRP